MRYALIGCGRIAVNHIMAAQSNHLEIVALCDINSVKMNLLAQKFSLENTVMYKDYREMIAFEKPELVAIATESGKHAEIAKYCILCGCNVIIEKPIALSLKDANEIILLAEKSNGVKVCACHQNRFNKSIQKLREAIESDRFGKLYHGVANIRWCRDKEYYDQATWRGTWEQDGGALMNQCIHNIDLLRWMMGDDVIEVVAITDQLQHKYLEAEDLGIAIIKFGNGSYGIVEGTVNVFPTNLEETLCIFGEKGTVKVGGKSVSEIEEWKFANDIESTESIKKDYSEIPSNVYGYGHKLLYADMIDAIQQDRQPYIDANAGKRALELVLAIYKSAQIGKKIKLPLSNCSTKEFMGRFQINEKAKCDAYSRK